MALLPVNQSRLPATNNMAINSTMKAIGVLLKYIPYGPHLNIT